MKLSIRSKVGLLGTFLAFVPTLIVSIVLSTISLDQGSKALREAAQQKLTAVRDATAQSIENYFKQIDDQVVTFSDNLMVIDAMKALDTAFTDYNKSLSADELAKRTSSVQQYYEQQFDAKFQGMNEGKSANPDAILQQTAQQSVPLQYLFISNNPAPLGQKDGMDKPAEDNPYSQLHAKYHPVLHEYQQHFGYYDIFLVNPAGDVVYTVFKELDFTTNLKNGPYANTGLGEAFKGAMALGGKDKFYITDFKPYVPSYNAPAAFVSSPIYDGNTLVGVLIFQMPVERINAVMTHNHEWKTTGLGDSGETYLVGPDKLMRSDGRFLIEDKSGYLNALRSLGVASATVDEIDQKETTIGLQTVDTKGVNEALGGNAGFGIFPDYRHVPVLSAYKPLNLNGLNWVVMSEIDESEAFAPIVALRHTILLDAVIACLCALVAGTLMGWLFAGVMTRPLKLMITTVNDIAQGEGDLTQRLPVKGTDEIAQLSQGINAFITHVDDTFSAVLKSVVRLVPISQDLADVNTHLVQSTHEQKQQADAVNHCLLETNESTRTVDNELSGISEATSAGNTVVEASQQVVGDVSKAMAGLSNNIEQAVQAIANLKGDTDRIATVIDVINGIAEQTNLLALNAAIEAARAGEAGRGFAVVADEVRSLASKTRQSTNEVTEMVTAIQSGTRNVVTLMESGKANADKSNAQVNEATAKLRSVTEAMYLISERVDRIAQAIEQQQHNFVQVTDRYEQMNASFESSQLSSAQASTVGHDVKKLGDKLMDMIKRFKVTDDNWSTQRRNKLRAEEEEAKRVAAANKARKASVDSRQKGKAKSTA
ncbi:methyl-accepting chemotaxis protein [Pokkaliibacter plantistimulans]|nr:methyl-accepting chemotaxis protein [Pokkaliibacter plantistimulans]